jgi:hypothetical protein
MVPSLASMATLSVSVKLELDFVKVLELDGGIQQTPVPIDSVVLCCALRWFLLTM